MLFMGLLVLWTSVLALLPGVLALLLSLLWRRLLLPKLSLLVRLPLLRALKPARPNL